MSLFRMTPGRDCPPGEGISVFKQLADAQQRHDTKRLEQAAQQQERRAVRMGRKRGRGNRRAARAAGRTAILREQVDTRQQGSRTP